MIVQLQENPTDQSTVNALTDYLQDITLPKTRGTRLVPDWLRVVWVRNAEPSRITDEIKRRTSMGRWHTYVAICNWLDYQGNWIFHNTRSVTIEGCVGLVVTVSSYRQTASMQAKLFREYLKVAAISLMSDSDDRIIIFKPVK